MCNTLCVKGEKMSEATFRRWLVANKPNKSLIQPIETSTGSGIPDLFYCCQHGSCWIELKETERTGCYMRVSQWLWFRKLRDARGKGFLIIKRTKKKPNTIDIYDVGAFLITKCNELRKGKIVGKDIRFDKVQPTVSIEVGSGHEHFYHTLHKLIKKKEKGIENES